MNHRQQPTRLASAWKQVLGIGLLLTIALPCAAQQKDSPPPDPDEQAAQQLADDLSWLVESVRLQDDAGLDQVICNDLRARARALREAQLGLIEDPEDPRLLSAIRHRQRAAVYRHFEKLALSGRQVNELEMER